jgi:hypothetical protein
MARKSPILIAAWFLASVLPAPATLRADVLDDFRVPDHRVLNWTGSFNGSGLWSHSSGSQLYEPRDRFVSRRQDGSFSNRLDWAHEADPARTTLVARVDLTGNRQTGERDHLSAIDARTASSVEHTVFRQLRESILLGASRDQFMTSIPMLWRIRADARIDDRQTWDTRDWRSTLTDGALVQTYVDERAHKRKIYSAALTSAVGIGTGRVRNATGLYEALVLERRLIAAGAIAEPLTPDARRRLGALMYVRQDYTGTRDRPARDLWDEIARILLDDGAIEEPLSPAVTMRLMEPFLGPGTAIRSDGLPNSPVTRRVGTEVVFEVQNRHQRETFHAHDNSLYQPGFPPYDTLPPLRSTFSSFSKRTSDDVLVAVTAAFHRPLGLRWQLDLSGRAIAAARHGVSADYDAVATATWVVTDRWLGTLGASHRWFDEKRTAGPTGGDRASWTASANVLYYVENATALSLGVSHSDIWIRGAQSWSDRHSYGRSTQVSLGVTRRFTGRFSAPDLALAPSPATIGLGL